MLVRYYSSCLASKCRWQHSGVQTRCAAMQAQQKALVRSGYADMLVKPGHSLAHLYSVCNGMASSPQHACSDTKWSATAAVPAV